MKAGESRICLGSVSSLDGWSIESGWRGECIGNFISDVRRGYVIIVIVLVFIFWALF